MFMHNRLLQYTVRVGGTNPGLANLMLEQFGVHLPGQFTNAPFASVGDSLHIVRTGAGINLPASFIQLLFASLFHSWPGSWAPAGLDFRSWRAISFPIFCLPFWWFEGLGLDGLLTRKHLHWRSFLLGTLLWGLFLTGLLAIQFAMSAEERTEMISPIWGFGLWVLLLSVFPIGWIIRWRNRRQHGPSC